MSEIIISTIISAIVSFGVICILSAFPVRYRPMLLKVTISVAIIAAGMLLLFMKQQSEIGSVQLEGQQVEFIEEGRSAYIPVRELSNMDIVRVRYEPESLTIMGEGWSIIQLDYLTNSLILRSDGSVTQSSTIIRRGDFYYIHAEMLRDLGMTVVVEKNK